MPRAGYGDCVVRARMGESEWRAAPPSAAAVRPPLCLVCGKGAWRGEQLRIISHGLRPRGQLGPSSATGSSKPTRRSVLARRYRCAVEGCGAVMLVAPASVAPRLQYSACAVGLAVALWAKIDGEMSRLPADVVAQGSGASSGRQLRRWTAAIAKRKIFPGLSRSLDLVASSLVQAGLAAQCLAGWASSRFRHGPLSSQAFAGAEHLP